MKEITLNEMQELNGGIIGMLFLAGFLLNPVLKGLLFGCGGFGASCLY